MTFCLHRRLLAASLVGAILAPSAWAALDYSDHPLLSGMPGFEVRSKDVKSYDEITLEPSSIYVRGGHYDGPVVFKGKVTALRYMFSFKGDRRSKIEIFRNYQTAIEKLGGKLLSSPFDKDGHGWQIFKMEQPDRAPVSVLLRIPYETEYELTIIESQAMTQSVQAGQLAKEIANSGFAMLYINFDTNQAVLKEDGQAAVREIAALLKQQPQLKLSIEGHTDNVGHAADNKKLSQARSEAVLKAVVAQGVDAKRLVAVGRGQEVPIADNRTETGRAKNRRVELVKR